MSFRRDPAPTREQVSLRVPLARVDLIDNERKSRMRTVLRLNM